jgi:DNA-binding PadR family transcriptional regulator
MDPVLSPRNVSFSNYCLSDINLISLELETKSFLWLDKTVERSLSLFESELSEHIVKSFLDILVLTMLYDEPMHGYKMIASIHNEFGVLLSPGTLYPLLYGLEEHDLIECRGNHRKKTYYITANGRYRIVQILKIYKKSIDKITRFFDENLSRVSGNVAQS